jgi:tetratricopeptide (TPR) repeat protein
MALPDPLPAKAAKLSLVAACVAFLLFSMSYSFFNAYAQQGGAATGGAATGSGATGGPATGGAATSGSVIGGSATCYGTCYYYGGPATGGQATGGAATNNGGNTGDSAKSSSPLIESYTSYDVVGLVQKGKELYKSGMYNEALTYFNKALDVDPNNKEALDYKDLSFTQNSFSLIQKAKSNIQQAHKDPTTVNQTGR